MTDLAPGDSFAGFRIERMLGAGGMGEVYLARHPRLPRMAALKVLLPELAEEEHFRLRFLREAEHAAQLDHPNIVAVLDRGQQGQHLWIAMQYIDGISAGAAVPGDQISISRALRIVRKAASALDYAHHAGVLHRDVKPDNILLAHPRADQPERVLLTDFGIAKSLRSSGGLTVVGELLASMPYAAPEQLHGAKDIDHRADVYALGVTLFELLSGERPYTGGHAALISAHLFGAIPRVSQTARGRHLGLSAGMDEVIQTAMAKDPRDRYRSCGALASAAREAAAAAAARVARAEERGVARTPTPTWSFVLVVVRRGRQILLVHERKYDQTWYFPAGRVQPGETLDRAAHRKTAEEAGIDITLEGIVAINHNPQTQSSARLRVIFVARPADDNLPQAAPSNKTLGAQWVTLQDLRHLPLRGGEVAAIANYVLGGGHINPLSLLTSGLAL
jgi:serine/threonine protein kinase